MSMSLARTPDAATVYESFDTPEYVSKFENGAIPESRIFDSHDSLRCATLHEARRRRSLRRRSDTNSARKVSQRPPDTGMQGCRDAGMQGCGRRIIVRTYTGAVATRLQVEMQPCQHGPKSAIRHDISPGLRSTFRNRKYCVLQVRLSEAEPSHRGRGQIPFSDAKWEHYLQQCKRQWQWKKYFPGI